INAKGHQMAPVTLRSLRKTFAPITAIVKRAAATVRSNGNQSNRGSPLKNPALKNRTTAASFGAVHDTITPQASRDRRGPIKPGARTISLAPIAGLNSLLVA